MTDVITLTNATHGFELGGESITLFEELNVEFHQGSSLSIIGPSGVGKSSLLLLLAGLEAPQKGTFRYSQDNSEETVSSLRKHSGFVFQHFHLLPELDALSNLALPLRLKGDREADEKALYWLDKVGLADRAKHRPNQLSGGEQQRVAIARAFVSSPRFVFADEPTGNLDQQTAHKIKGLILACAKEQGAGLLYVTHDPEFASMADRCLSLGRDGLKESQTVSFVQEAIA